MGLGEGEGTRDGSQVGAEPSVTPFLSFKPSFQAGAFRDKCGSVTDFAGCTAALPGSLGADLTGIANGGEPTTVNKIAFPTLFQMWQDM